MCAFRNILCAINKMERQVMPFASERNLKEEQKKLSRLVNLLYTQRVKIEEFMCVYVFESELKKENFNDN